MAKEKKVEQITDMEVDFASGTRMSAKRQS